MENSNESDVSWSLATNASPTSAPATEFSPTLREASAITGSSFASSTVTITFCVADRAPSDTVMGMVNVLPSGSSRSSAPVPWSVKQLVPAATRSNFSLARVPPMVYCSVVLASSSLAQMGTNWPNSVETSVPDAVFSVICRVMPVGIDGRSLTLLMLTVTEAVAFNPPSSVTRSVKLWLEMSS